MDKIGTGVVGLGGNGQRHAHLYDAMDETELIGVCDVIPEVAEEVAARHGVKAFTSVEDMLAEDAIQAVNVVTSASHRDPAVAAAEAGRHVLVEVPFAVTLDECDEMISAADRAGVNLMYAQTHRFMPGNLAIKKLIDGGEIGDVVWISHIRTGSGTPDASRWHRWKAQGGGVLTYEGPHYLDQFRWLAGSDYATANSVSMGRYASAGDGEDNCIAGMTFTSGASAVLLEGMSELGGRYEEWRIAGTIGAIESVGGNVRLGRGDWTDVDYAYKIDEPLSGFEKLDSAGGYLTWTTEFSEWLDSITEKRAPSCTGHDGRAALEAALALRESDEKGGPVPIRSSMS
jgi:predicted dehydrogenase